MDIYIIEDSLAFRSRLVKLLAEIHDPFVFDDWDVIPVTNIFAIKTLNIQNNSLFLIDVDLKSTINGIDIGTEIRSLNTDCYIVFLTSYDNLGRDMINSKIYPLSYLVKTDDEQALTLELTDVLTDVQLDIKNRSRDGKQIILKNQSQAIGYQMSDILYLATSPGMKNTLVITTTYGEFFIDGKITAIKKQFETDGFYLQLKSYIINLSAIKSIDHSIGFVYFKNDTILELNSPSARKLLNHFKARGGA